MSDIEAEVVEWSLARGCVASALTPGISLRLLHDSIRRCTTASSSIVNPVGTRTTHEGERRPDLRHLADDESSGRVALSHACASRAPEAHGSRGKELPRQPLPAAVRSCYHGGK